MEIKKLSDVCECILDGYWIESKDQSDSGIRLIQTGNIGVDEFLDKKERARYISDETFNALGCTEVYEGDILISRLPDPVGRACSIPATLGRSITAVDCTVIRLNSMCTNRYLLNFTESFNYQRQLARFLAGTTRTRISRKNLEKIEIPLPNLEEQIRIAERIDSVKKTIMCRREQLAKLDELVKSRFIELFGDPETNPKGWDRQRFDQICENLDSRRVPITSTERKAGNYPYYGASGIVDYVEDYIFDEDILLISEDGANLLMRSTPIAFSVSGKVWVNNHAHVVRFETKATQKYIEVCFALTDISGSITGTAQPKLNQAKLNAMLFCIPPIELQEQFAAFVEQIDKSKFEIQQSLEKLETLKKALMQKYFG